VGLFGRPGGARGGSSIRIIIGLVIAVIALISYFMRTEVNPVTGEKQRIAMTTEQEITLGLQAAPEMAAQMGGVVDTRDPQAALVRNIGKKVWQSSDAVRSPYTFEFHLLRDPESINAFALPGGQIFITRGLLDQLENEAQLAGVLGHEIGHVINRHAAEHMAKSQLGGALAAAAGVAASDERGRGLNAALIAQAVNQMMQLRYGRKDELEADDYGLRYMIQAGYDPSAMVSVMHVLAQASKGRGGPEFLATHPHPEARIKQIERFLAEKYPNGIPPDLTAGRSLQLMGGR